MISSFLWVRNLGGAWLVPTRGLSWGCRHAVSWGCIIRRLGQGCLTWLWAGGLVPYVSAGLLDCAPYPAPSFPYSEWSKRRKEKAAVGSHCDFYDLVSEVAHHADWPRVLFWWLSHGWHKSGWCGEQHLVKFQTKYRFAYSCCRSEWLSPAHTQGEKN